MRTIRLSLLLAFLAAFIPNFSYASSRVENTSELRQTLIQKMSSQKDVVVNFDKKENKGSKFMSKIAHKLEKWASRGIDFSDPVNKWMWFWILGWGAGAVLSIVGLLGISSLFWLFGTVCLIIWLVKKFS